MMERFKRATKKWQRFVSQRHHKDQDCHWYLSREKVFSYGDDKGQVQWVMRHEGYITQFYTCGQKWQDVVEETIKFIDKFIKKYEGETPDF